MSRTKVNVFSPKDRFKLCYLIVCNDGHLKLEGQHRKGNTRVSIPIKVKVTNILALASRGQTIQKDGVEVQLTRVAFVFGFAFTFSIPYDGDYIKFWVLKNSLRQTARRAGVQLE